MHEIQIHLMCGLVLSVDVLGGAYLSELCKVSVCLPFIHLDLQVLIEAVQLGGQ